MTRYRLAGVSLDALVLVTACVVGLVLRAGPGQPAHSTAAFLAFGGVMIVGWILALEYTGAYKLSHVATGSDEVGRVLRASITILGVIAVACYAAKNPIGHVYVIAVVPLGTVLLLTQRSAFRSFVVAKSLDTSWSEPVIAVGTESSVRRLVRATQRANGAGVSIVGACVDDAPEGKLLAPGVPVLGSTARAAACAYEAGANAVFVPGEGSDPADIEELGWEMECVGRRLSVAHVLSEATVRSARARTVGGLPIVWLEQAQLANVQKFVKRVLDLVGGVALLLVLSPLLLATALAIKLTSRGPVLFTQRRLGVNGREFTIFKFRSMYVGAEARRAEIIHLNEQDGGGVLFKIRQDPRVTPVGRFIRKWSIDELPQVLNVLSGAMSLVGPRPLAAEDSNYTGAARRRLRVRPGITGLWQISGRSDLSWDEAVRLDLYYVENWTLGLDLSILARTFFAVLVGRGAY